MSWLLSVIDDQPESILFPVMDKLGGVTGRPVAPRKALAWLQSKLRAVGIPTPERYGLHSARRGGLSDAIE